MRRERGDRGARWLRTGAALALAGALVTVGGGSTTGQPTSGSGGEASRATTDAPAPGSLRPLVEAGADSIRSWQRSARDKAGDRAALYGAVRDVLERYDRVQNRVAQVYPPNQLEWLLITDSIADTLTESLVPLMDRFRETHPEEILTEGRQLVESEMMSIVGPPPRMLGFHVVMLADRIIAAMDSMQAAGRTKDTTGLQEGFLRHLDDWVRLYQQVHSDPIAVFESRLVQEDWIIVRLEDQCGNSGGGTWKFLQQWMTLLEADSTLSPPRHRWAHEYHLVAQECPGDSRVIYIELPNYDEVQLELLRLQEEGKLSPPGREGGR